MVILWIAFFLSGIAGLAYEITWMRYLHQLLGASTPAVSVTVSIFFAGMALGAVWGGRFFDRHPDPLRLYARLELLIAISASTVPFLFQAADALLAYLPSQHENTALLLALSTAILCLPATLIGAVFPAMAAVVRHLPNPTHATGYFYGFNTLGAVIGCFVVAFWWLPYAGQAATTWSMALLNLAIALWLRTLRLPTPSPHSPSIATDIAHPSVITTHPHTDAHPSEDTTHPHTDAHPSAITTHPHTDAHPSEDTTHPHTDAHPSEDTTHPHADAHPSEDTTHPHTDAHPSERTTPTLPFMLFLLLAAASGLLSISLEVLWTRSLSLVLPTSVADFGLVMSAYLLGVGAGSLWIGRCARARPPSASTLWRAYLAIAAASLLPVLCFPRIPAWRSTLLAAYGTASWNTTLFFDNFFAFVLMFPVTFLMGIALPILIGLATQDRRQTGSTAGRLYAVNTVGSILGSLAVAFWWMPTFGIAESLWLIAAAYGSMALALLCWLPSTSFVRLSLASGLALALWVWQQDRCPQINPAKHQPHKRLLFYKDATALTLAVYETATSSNAPPHRSLAINNDDDTTSTHPHDLQRQYLLGHFSYALSPKAQNVLLLGLSNGSTLAALAQHPSPHIQCVEEHPLLSSIAPLFHHANLSVWKNPRIRILHQNKLRFLQRSNRSFDLIIDDLFRPSAHLDDQRFSLPYLSAVQQRLQPDGLYISWLPLHRLSPNLLASLLPPFLRTFQHTQLFVADWNPHAPLVALVASRQAQRIAAFPKRSPLPSPLPPILQALHTIQPASFQPLLSQNALALWSKQVSPPLPNVSLRAAILHDQIQHKQRPSFAEQHHQHLLRLCSPQQRSSAPPPCDLTHTPWRPMQATSHRPALPPPALSTPPSQKPLRKTTLLRTNTSDIRLHLHRTTRSGWSFLRTNTSGLRSMPAAIHSSQYTVKQICDEHSFSFCLP
ncbi:fused MFS/spermidine synthase [Myxococcota bacterium]|nr:fused MFS/spermidine synthase [Myxococcota bacterium]